MLDDATLDREWQELRAFRRSLGFTMSTGGIGGRRGRYIYDAVRQSPDILRCVDLGTRWGSSALTLFWALANNRSAVRPCVDTVDIKDVANGEAAIVNGKHPPMTPDKLLAAAQGRFKKAVTCRLHHADSVEFLEYKLNSTASYNLAVIDSSKNYQHTCKELWLCIGLGAKTIFLDDFSGEVKAAAKTIFDALGPDSKRHLAEPVKGLGELWL